MLTQDKLLLASSTSSSSSHSRKSSDDTQPLLDRTNGNNERAESPPPTDLEREEAFNVAKELEEKYGNEVYVNNNRDHDDDIEDQRSSSPDFLKQQQTSESFLNPLYSSSSSSSSSKDKTDSKDKDNVPAVNLTKDQCVGQVLRLAKSHSGSRFIQQKLEQNDRDFFDVFYREMRESLANLMVDNFGHFAIERLVLKCTDEQKLDLLRRLAPNMCQVACQKHGSFSVQALMDSLTTSEQIAVLCDSLKKDVLKVMTHSSGHFVVLRFLQRFAYIATKFVDDAIVDNCLQIGTDHHGLRIVKAILSSRKATELNSLFKQVARLTMKLVENQYGNYVVQSVLDVAPAGVRTNIKVKMEGKFLRLSKSKFSSNVVEKCLKQSSSHWRAIIIKELIAQPAVCDLLRDRYGNYVLQTALSVGTPQQVSFSSCCPFCAASDVPFFSLIITRFLL
jgi:hypothetical protein